ncbi:MAG: hypothetical protein CM15mP12_1090 [Gammaproteobacteria bacterium]|nr:MAG: hypothetical protein CM15mP12_1090 [Gammaproteobacteria bacterium]
MHSHCIGDFSFGVYVGSGSTGVTLTSEAFSQTLGPIGSDTFHMCVVLSFGAVRFLAITLQTVILQVLIGENAGKTISIFCNTQRRLICDSFN